MFDIRRGVLNTDNKNVLYLDFIYLLLQYWLGPNLDTYIIPI